jgi:ribonuclease D
MQSPKLPPATFVDNPKKLGEMIPRLMKEPVIAVDTESNSLYAYQERVCLIQFSTPDKDYLVDPLAIDDLSPLGRLFASSKIEKIFHAAEYDLIMLDLDFGYELNALFDTMVAARILGWKAVGLGSILQDQFGIQVQKKYQRANWGRRPLPDDMLTYAQLDTHYLIPLRAHLKVELEAADRWPLAQEDFRRGCQVHTHHQENNAVDCWRVNGARELNPRQLAVLQEVCIYRDQIARSSDRPLFKVINNKTLYQIAENCPNTSSELESIKGFSQKQMRWLGRGLLAAVKRGLKAKQAPKLPHKPRPSEAYLIRVDKLRQWRKNTARAMGVESDIVLPKDLLFDLAEKNPLTYPQISEILHSVPWRLERFGSQIFDLLSTEKRIPSS